MKKIIVAFLFASSAIAVTAQTTKNEKKQQLSPEERATKQTERMHEKLSFSSEQKDKVHAINLAKNKEIDASHTTNMNNKKLFVEEKKKINRERMKEIRALFTREQNKTWNELIKDRKEKKGGQKLSPSGGTSATEDELDTELSNQLIRD